MSIHHLPIDVLDIITNFVSHIADVIRLERTCKKLKESSKRRKWLAATLPLEIHNLDQYKMLQLFDGMIMADYFTDVTQIKLENVHFFDGYHPFVNFCHLHPNQKTRLTDKMIVMPKPELTYTETHFSFQNGHLTLSGDAASGWDTVVKLFREKNLVTKLTVDVMDLKNDHPFLPKGIDELHTKLDKWLSYYRYYQVSYNIKHWFIKYTEENQRLEQHIDAPVTWIKID